MAIERVGAGHPDACESSTRYGPCEYRAVPGTRACPLHGGSIKERSNEKSSLRNYQINTSVWSERANSLSASPGIQSLRDEIVLARVAVENLMNLASNANQLLLYSDKLMTMVSQIRALVESSTKLEERSKELIDRETLKRIIDAMIGVLVVRITDPVLLSLLADELYACFVKGISGEDAASSVA